MDMDLPIPGEGGEDWGDTNMDFGRDSPVGGSNTDPDVEEFPNAAQPIGSGQTFMEWLDSDQFALDRKKNIYYPFASKAEWEMASFLMRSSMTMKDIDDFFKLQHVCYRLQWRAFLLTFCKVQEHLPLSFKSAKELRARVELLPKGPQWKCETITYEGYPTKTPIILYYRDPLECLEFLLKNPLLKKHLDLIPKRKFQNGRRVWSEWITGDGAWEMQVPFFIPRQELPS
jgi:hypothetical protein